MYSPRMHKSCQKRRKMSRRIAEINKKKLKEFQVKEKKSSNFAGSYDSYEKRMERTFARNKAYAKIKHIRYIG